VVPVLVAGAPIILANDNGTIRAFHNVCRHRGAQLVSEKCTKRRTILCPYHRWGYALDGRLMGTPSFDDDPDGKKVPEKLRELFKTGHVKNFDKSEMGLFPVRVDTSLGVAFVNLDDKAPPLTEWLGDLLPALEEYIPALSGPNLTQATTTSRKTYNVKSNWKVLIENFLEYYHLPAVHPALCDVSGVDEHVPKQGKGMYMAFATAPLTKGGTAIDPGQLPPFEGLTHPNTEMAWHINIFPNIFFSLYPDNFFRVILQADGPENTIESAMLLSHKPAQEAEGSKKVLEGMFRFWDNVNTEDIEICEKVQIGTNAAPYSGGRFSFRFEETLHRFQNMVVDKVVGGEHMYRIPEGHNRESPSLMDNEESKTE